jgi:hypothetical protein
MKEKSALMTETIPFDTIMQRFKKFPEHSKFIILDACKRTKLVDWATESNQILNLKYLPYNNNRRVWPATCNALEWQSNGTLVTRN